MFFCDRILPAVNRGWDDRSVRANSLLNATVSISDEAFAMLTLENNIDYWINKKLPRIKVKRVKKRDGEELDPDTQEESQDPELSLKKGDGDENVSTGTDESPDKQRSTASEEKESERYWELFYKVKSHRASDTENSWDQGFKDYISADNDAILQLNQCVDDESETANDSKPAAVPKHLAEIEPWEI